ncbi:MAG: tetratricopeptide repeat protein [Anaeromyxobacter sp.]|nr:tetratricopeptide repeat protein [Anaeromyxobacter sp.]MBL0274963.1 tetratricopeptide repeat protein [Anaeromyxobacter sp.]
MSDDRYQGFRFDPAALAEDVDLDAERRREILFAEASLATWTHFDLLGLPWNASTDAARAAYVDKVKLFHPDRYPGKRLGSYRARLEKVFRRLTEARDALADEARRAAYARATAPALELTRLEARRLEDERRGEERRARLSRQNPLLARASRVADLLKRGREGMAAGAFQQAANDFQMVASLDPSNREAAELAADCRRRSLAGKVQELVDRAHASEVMSQWGAALSAYRAAIEVDPTAFGACILASRAARELGDLSAAREHAEQATRAAPRNGAAHEALGLALEGLGQKGEAKKALERALELDPRLESAKERLKKLRWSFLG